MNGGIPKERKRWLTICGICMIVICGCSLRSNEGFMIDLQELISHIKDSRENREHTYVVIPLLGRFKNNLGEIWHLQLVASVTKSRFKVRMLYYVMLVCLIV